MVWIINFPTWFRNLASLILNEFMNKVVMKKGVNLLGEVKVYYM